MSCFDKTRVAAVAGDMERHCLGHEGMEDSPVARWARELRAALKSDVSMSAYDLLPADERDAIALVREHGGLDAVKRRWECLSYYADPVPRSCMERRLARLQRQIDESHAALRRRNQRIEELGHHPPFIVGRLPEPGAYRSVRVVYPSGAFTFLDPERLTHTKPEPPDSRQAVINEIGDEMAARIDLLVSSGRWSDAD